MGEAIRFEILPLVAREGTGAIFCLLLCLNPTFMCGDWSLFDHIHLHVFFLKMEVPDLYNIFEYLFGGDRIMFLFSFDRVHILSNHLLLSPTVFLLPFIFYSHRSPS